MFELSGYEIGEIIYKSEKSTICKAIRNADSKKVFIKLQNNEYPTIEELISIKKEYMITAKNYGDKVIKVYEAKNYKNTIALVLEDFGAKPLSGYLATKKLDLKKKLYVSVNIAEALMQIHKQGVIHKDINPFNIVWNYETDEIKIIDFGIATELINDRHYNSNTFEGTCLYISPEQTGKINRLVDFRSDLYSTGVTLYEVFTGKPPFAGDELEIIYSHIAKIPVEPKTVSNEIPSTISDIIMKLLSKNAEDRYQTAAGLKYDLQYCLENLYTRDKIIDFRIAQNDMSNRFEIPQKLYGRENDINKLKDLIKCTKKDGAKILLVSGYSGIGKTTIIQEISQDIYCKGCRFISGKFEQFERNNPYCAIKKALGMLIKNVVSEVNKFDFWKNWLQNALGTNAGILVDFLPELEQIIGKQPELFKMDPVEEKIRFNLVLSNFIKVFANNENQLIMFLDDLQWSDLSSLDILEHLLSSSEINNLIVIGSYRENEVKDGHPLLSMLDEVKKNLGNSNFLYQHNLEPLKELDVNQLIADTLKYNSADTIFLSNYVYQKTKGNPFFTYQLLKALHKNKLFRFNEEISKWEWNIEEIRNVQISDNVVDLLIQNLKLLPSDVLNILKLASCIGNYFNFKIICKICEDVREISDALKIAIEKEYVIPLDNNYRLLNIEGNEYSKSDIEIKFRFNHSRIQQAVYSLVSDNDKEIIHYKIGKILLSSYDNKKMTGSELFEITNHMNIGKNIINNKTERLVLLDLNYNAGKRAKRNTAYDIARNYYAIAKNMLSDEEWIDFPKKLFDLSLEHVESCYLSGNLEEILVLCDNTFKSASNNVEKAIIYELKAKILDHTGEKREIIIDEIKKGLNLFGIDLPSDPKEIDLQVGTGVGKMQGYLANNSVEELVNQPVLKDANKIMVMKLLFQLSPIAFEFYPPLHTLVKLKMFDIAISFGTFEVSCKNFAECGIFLGPVLGNYEVAYKFNKVAFLLIDKYKADAFKASTYFIFATFISHWKKHYSEGLQYLELSIKNGIETGDIIHASWSTTYKVDHNFFIGKNLDEYKLELGKAEKFLMSYKAMLLLPFIKIMRHVVNQFQSEYNWEVENIILDKITKANNMTVAFKFGQFNIMINYILGNYESAQKWVDYTEPYIQAGTGLFSMADYVMFSSLSLIKKYEKETDINKKELLEKIQSNLNSLKVWSVNCPENFQHKYCIVAAELSRVQNDSLETITGLYKKSLDSIVPGEFINIKAVINESIGEFWFSRNEETIGKTYIREAIYYYNNWGAYIKAELIEKKYPNFSTEIEQAGRLSRRRQSDEMDSTRQTSIHSGTINLDIKSILKSTQAISSEIKLDRLLKVLMSVIIENAGAQNGCVILKNINDEKLYVEAVKNSEIDEIIITKSIPLTESKDFCPEIVQYVKKTHEIIVISNAMKNSFYKNNDYIKRINAKSILCIPIIYKNDLNGIIYLENNLAENVFDYQRIEIIEILSSQIAISVEKAQLYEKMEDKVNERTKQLAMVNSELKELSLHDPLTKLYNRRYVYEYITNLSENFVKSKLELFFNRQKRDISISNNVMGIFLLDIDHFKKVNDTFGHAAGDSVLVKITEILKSIVRSEDFVVRWGGEEFLILLNKTKVEYLEMFSEKVLTKVKETGIKLPNKTVINKTCSMGCAYLPFEMRYSDILTLEQTVNICDFALYQAKEHGRDCSVHVSLAKSEFINDHKMKEYMANLTKDSTINNEFINIKYIRSKTQSEDYLAW